MLDQARIAWADGDGDAVEAEVLYRVALRRPKMADDAREELVALYVELGDAELKSRPKKADEYYTKALALDSEDEDALVGKGKALMARVMPDQALQLMEKAAATGRCTGCRRLLAVLLFDRGERWASIQRWDEAEKDYVRAMEIIPNADVALDIVQIRIRRKDVDAAAAGLRPAAELIGVADEQARAEFIRLRREVVLASLAADKVEVAEALLDLAPTGVGPEAQVGIAMETAVEMAKHRKFDPAIARISALAEAAASGRLRVSPEVGAQLAQLQASLHVLRSGAALGEGDLEGAQADLNAAAAVAPDDIGIRLQRVLMAVAAKGIGAGEAALRQVPTDTPGRNQIDAIVGSLRVSEAVNAGRVDAARSELARIQRLAGDLPEVHIAAAEVLAATEVAGLSKPQMSGVLEHGAVAYPAGRITRVGEALAELDWAQQAIESGTGGSAFRGPGADKRLHQLRTRLMAFFPYEVKFHSQPTTVVVIRNQGSDMVELSLHGAGGFEATAKVGPGKDTRFDAPSGFTELHVQGQQMPFIAEPYTQLRVTLPVNG